MVAPILAALVFLASAAPALADSGAQVPEGSHLTLLALGVIGVIIGRRASIKAKSRKLDKD